MLRISFCAVALFALSACRLDVTQTIDVRAKGTEVITYRETFDDEAFNATTQLGGASAFGFDEAKQNGWDVRGLSGPNEHTFVFKRSFSATGVEPELTRLAYAAAAATPDDAFFMGPTAFIGLPITASTANAQISPVPALLRPSEAVKKNDGRVAAFHLTSARINASAVDAVVHVHIQVVDSRGTHRIEPFFARATTPSPSSRAAIHLGAAWPISPILAFWRYEGPYGVYDLVHNSPPLCKADSKYRKSWMFGVGVYAKGAKIPEQLMASAGTLAEKWLTNHPIKCP